MARSKRPDMSARLDETAAPPTADSSPGRGRDAFSAAPAPVRSRSLAEVAVELIDPSPTNPRSALGELEGLADSIREQGVVSPLLVRAKGKRYELIYGHRRLAAAQLAGRATVPVFFDTGNDDEVRDQVRRLVENLHREDLSSLDEARAYHQLLALRVAGGQQGLAKMIGKSQGHISKRIGLLRLPEDVQESVATGTISATDAGELTKLAGEPDHLRNAVKDARWAGGIPSAVQRELRQMERDKRRRAKVEELRATGVTVLEDPPVWNRQDGPCPLMWLTGVDVEEHTKLRCHAAVLSAHSNDPMMVCLDPQAHQEGGDAAADQAARQAAQRAERKAAEDTATESRRRFAKQLAQGKSVDGSGLLMTLLLADDDYYCLYPELTAALLDLKLDTFNHEQPRQAIRKYVAKGTRNAQRAVYATALALGESAMSECDWRSPLRRPYCDHLVAAGYQLGDVETALLDDDAQGEDES